MSAINYSLKLNVKSIEKDRLFVGEKGVYLDAVIIMRENEDEYGNIGMVVQSVSEEERKKGKKGAIIGNVKKIIKKQKNEQEAAKELDDLPF